MSKFDHAAGHPAGPPARRGSVWAAGLLLSVVLSGALPAAAQQTILQYAEQGWTPADRNTFYGTSQGSHLMPYTWFRSLRRLDIDQPFGADQLERYGYLRNDQPSNKAGLPVGFVIEGSPEFGQLGMTCAACHTGQIEYQKGGARYALRIDGAPAMSDFQQFLTDLRDAASATLTQPARFDAFAHTALGAGYSAAAADDLRVAFGGWVAQFQEFMTKSLPARPWGPGRLDAFGMIFNRVTARDLGVPGNFAVADAPVSYPFLWNASRQDHTQWTGSVPNGLYISALARNTGEVFGVFADFKPAPTLLQHTTDPLLAISYRDNSADFLGLQILEEKIKTLKPPRWPSDVGDDFRIDPVLAATGKALYATTCAGCHAIPNPAQPGLWQTPVQVVGTDPKMAANADRSVGTGIFKGVLLPIPEIGLYGDKAPATTVLASSVLGAIIDGALDPSLILPGELAKNGVWRAINKDFASLLPDERGKLSLFDPEGVKATLQARLGNLFRKPAAGAAYEARVLYGIWATAPYLHNGSVPNLWELLQPPAKRKPSFMVGSRTFDPKAVGFATDASPYQSGTFTADPASGNGNQGHDYGTNLQEDQRWAILEYLKTL